ncbi:MAG: hypothetical protein ACRD3P_11865 [Terriglobales bacterium]
MADSNLPQFADPIFEVIFDNVFNRQIRLADRLLAEALLRECLKEERCPQKEN